MVVGGGPSGLIAAINAAGNGVEVLLLEKTASLGNKLLLSGKTRCNITNAEPLENFLLAYGDNGKWLRNAFARFFRDDLIDFFAQNGVICKQERGGRIFPASDAARDVLFALQKELKATGVEVVTDCAVKKIITKGGVATGVVTSRGEFPASAVILATGGASYPQTGSSGDGFKMARAVGHTIVTPMPALVPLVVQEVELAKAMQGVSLKNVRLFAFACKSEAIVTDWLLAATNTKKYPQGNYLIGSEFGELLFTHFGLGGPIVLSLSLAINKALSATPAVSVAIDLKPALSLKQLEARIQRDCDAYGKRTTAGILAGLLPSKMVAPFVSLLDIPADKRACDINAVMRGRMATALKSLRFNITRSLPLSRAIVTAGGVSLAEVNPQTMESLTVKRLFFCGEVIDIAGDTGGYNLQAAFSTGFQAGKSANHLICRVQER
ncbi:MAG: NAD(P)/FAD-dependent oxidoreductase [Deltaproteobacteria bacterium]|nr:NAD(P)/FAD-dependent oxidoreductase [Deltaproteobacteria bacterium]